MLLLPPPDVEGDGLDNDGLLLSAGSLTRCVVGADGLEGCGNVEDPETGV